jgi:CDP-6-deoxy-D-xylo-4-hexulose-3-dehydrase
MSDRPGKPRYLLAERTIDGTDLRDLITWLQGDPWLTQGALVRRFQEGWASWLGVKRAVYVNSGSSANLLAYAVLDVGRKLDNRKIIVPAVAWATTVAPAIQLGFEPIMCDAESETFGMDMEMLERLCTQHQPIAVVVVHVLGVPVQLERLMHLRRKYGFTLIEDACAATGSTYDGRRVGPFGDLATFSFFYGHHLSTIEGGMVCTSDEKLADLLMQLRAHGWGKDLPEEKEAELAENQALISSFNRPFTFYHPGFNVRATDLQAHIGLSQLARVDHVVARRAENHLRYQTRFRGSSAFRCQENPRAIISSIAFCASASSGAHRDRVARALRAAGVETRPVGGGNMSRQPFWRDRFGAQAFPVGDLVHDRCFQLPNHPGLSLEDIDHICDTVLAVQP